MKILHTIRSVDPAGGGPIEGVKQQAAIWQQFGYDVEVACLDSPSASWISEFGFTVHALGPSVGKYGFSLRYLAWLRRHAGEYAVVVINGIWAFNSLGTFIGLLGKDVPYVVFTHGMLDPWFKRQYPLKHLKKWLYWPWAEYMVLSRAAFVLFTCEEERRVARESFWLYRANEKVVQYGTAAPPPAKGDQTDGFLDTFPELRGKRLILFLSRIHGKKGCDLAIRAFARVCHEPEFHLVMAGPDSSGLKRELLKIAQEEKVGDRISWPGMLRGDMKWGAFRSSEVFLLPSHQENFGIVVAEAMACGLPVLISNKVNIWREIVDANAGFAEEDTLSGTVLLLQRWRNVSDEKREKMRSAAIQCFEEKFEIVGVVANLVRVLGEVTYRTRR